MKKTKESPATPSPRYRAERSDRYLRKELIAQIEEELGGGCVVTYFGNGGFIDSPDVGCFVESLAWFDRRGKELLIILETPGGDPQVVRNWVEIARERFKRLIVAVPGRAKSAGTLLCLAADEVWAGPGSEFGPIDPQVPVPFQGQVVRVSAIQFLQELGVLEPHPDLKQIQANRDLVALRQNYTPPGLVSKVMLSLRATYDMAIDYLYRYHLREVQPAIKRAAQAFELANFLTMIEPPQRASRDRVYLHSDYISPKALSQRGMKIKYYRFREELWKLIYQLYAHYQVALGESPNCVIFESRDLLYTRPA